MVLAGGSSLSYEPASGGGSGQHWLSAAFGEVDEVKALIMAIALQDSSPGNECQVVRDQCSRKLGHKALRRAMHSQPGPLYLETGAVLGTQ